MFIQAAANLMMGGDLAIDGAYGPLTNAVFHEMKKRLDIPHRVSSKPAV